MGGLKKDLMPIFIKYKDRHFIPVFICDGCGREIVDYRKARYVFNSKNPDGKTLGKVYFAHKGGRCSLILDEALKEKNLEAYWHWDDLEIFFRQLLHNVQIDTER